MNLESRIKKLEGEVGADLPSVCVVVRGISTEPPQGPMTTLRHGSRTWRREEETEAAFVGRVRAEIGSVTCLLVATTEDQQRRRLVGGGRDVQA